MSKSTRIMFIAFAVVLAIHMGLSVAFVCEVYNKADDLRHQDTQNMLFLQAQLNQNDQRIQALEQDVSASTPSQDQPCIQCPADDVEVQTEKAYLYTVRRYNDVIGVFDGSGRLIKVINVHYDTLPQADQQALTRGIRAFSTDELQQLLAAYS